MSTAIMMPTMIIAYPPLMVLALYGHLAELVPINAVRVKIGDEFNVLGCGISMCQNSLFGRNEISRANVNVRISDYQA